MSIDTRNTGFDVVGGAIFLFTLASEVTAPDRKAVIFQIDLPLQSLKPGFYTCQVNVIDDNAGNFAFPRWPILVKEAAPPTPASTPSAAPSGAPSGH